MKHIINRLLLIILALSFWAGANAQVSSSLDLITSMYDRYHKKWYTNLTFVQKTSYYKEGDFVREEIWYEAMKMPEGLIIKYDSLMSASGMMFKNDTMSVFKNGKLVNSTRRVHELLVLGFSVYFDPATKTLQKLKEAGFDVSSFKEEENHFVIGHPSSKQAWISKDQLLFTRLENANSDGSRSAIEFKNYVKLGKAWIAPEVIFYRNGIMMMKEEYSEIATPKKLPNLFDQEKFKDIIWKN
jgi:hypothetical protein